MTTPLPPVEALARLLAEGNRQFLAARECSAVLLTGSLVPDVHAGPLCVVVVDHAQAGEVSALNFNLPSDAFRVFQHPSGAPAESWVRELRACISLAKYPVCVFVGVAPAEVHRLAPELGCPVLELTFEPSGLFSRKESPQ